jgi:hypothetical protein
MIERQKRFAPKPLQIRVNRRSGIVHCFGEVINTKTQVRSGRITNRLLNFS